MTNRERIAVSACLLGEACRFDGRAVPCPGVIALAGRYELVPICPEQLGGLPTPREPAEITATGRVVNRAGEDVTAAFEEGARIAVETALSTGCTRAVLKARSPSCGVREVYDGTFSGTLVDGMGIAAAALSRAGIEVRDEESRDCDAAMSRSAS